MNYFENIVQLKTGRDNLIIKAVYVPNTLMSTDWAYYLYYYDLLKNTFYINDIDKLWNEHRASAINMIEHIVNEAYKLEMNSLLDFMRKVQIENFPNVKFVYNQKYSDVIIIDNVTLTPIKDREWVIRGFKNPQWNWEWEKYTKWDNLLCRISQTK